MYKKLITVILALTLTACGTTNNAVQEQTMLAETTSVTEAVETVLETEEVLTETEETVSETEEVITEAEQPVTEVEETTRGYQSLKPKLRRR